MTTVPPLADTGRGHAVLIWCEHGALAAALAAIVILPLVEAVARPIAGRAIPES